MLMLLLLSGAGFAYETDQLTDRELPLEDAAPLIDARLEALLEEAATRTNERTNCQAEEARTRQVLAREIARLTVKPRWVMQRGLTRAPGFTLYSAWIEEHPDIDKRAWERRDDLYGDMTPWQSVILTAAGPSSTIRVGDALVGTDKFDHFLGFGYIGWRRSDRGEHPERAMRFSTRTERQFFGMITSKTYSYGDIAANNDGFRWFNGLLGSTSPLRLDDRGCVVRAGPMRWEEHVDWRYDEAMNPPLYTALVQRRVTSRIAREPERYCRAWMALGGPAYDAHLAELLARRAPLPRRYDERIDPFALGVMCAEDRVEPPRDAPIPAGDDPNRVHAESSL